MKRNFVKETQTQDESLAQGTTFAKVKKAEGWSQNAELTSHGRRAYGGGEEPSDGFQPFWKGISEVQNFLKNPPLQKYNISPVSIDEATGKAVFETNLDISNIQHLQVIILDKE